MVEPKKPVVGLNDFEIAIHRRETKDNFPFMNNLMVTIEPEMPTMGHGSPDNVDPMHEEMGHYKGKINFTHARLLESEPSVLKITMVTS